MTDETFDDETLRKMYSPKPNPWFSSEIIYEGWGVASFDKPSGTIEGKTKISTDSTGQLDVVMECERLNTDVTIHGSGSFRYLKFLNSDLSEGNIVGIGVGNVNPCVGLKVETEQGVFEAEGKLYYFNGWGLDSKLQFSIHAGTYTDKEARKPNYWALPLINYVSSFHTYYHPAITQHPLRLFTTPIVPEIDDETQKKMALFVANSANQLIGFEFGEAVGYIQPTLDYNEQTKKLKSGEIKKAITALMVSEVTSKVEETWFPYDYTSLISFAIGVQVGAPWIEYRDENGKLTSRRHILEFTPEYKKGYNVIEEPIDNGLGHLISIASSSTEFGQSYYRVLIAHLVRLQSYSRQVEDCMDLICRTLDSLCEKFGFSVQNLAQKLPESRRADVKSILDEARRKVERLSRAASPDEQSVLQQIASKIANSQNTDRAFGLAVTDLLNKYELPDLEIMNEYYVKHSESNGMIWAQILTKYRGAAMHTGYFSQDDFNIQDVLILIDHLHDILVRIALKILNYERYYQPRVISHVVDKKDINWINTDTPAATLGYKAPII